MEFKVDRQTERGQKSTQPALVGAAILAAVGLLAVATQTKQNSPSAALVTIENNDSGSLHVQWGSNQTSQSIYFDRVPAAAQCDSNNCTAQKPTNSSEIFIRWFDPNSRQWFYFQCPSTFRGQFYGTPYNKS